MWQAVVESWRNLRREQRLSVVLLGVCGFTAIGLSLYRVTSAINDPFLVDKAQLTAAKNIVGETPEEKEALQKRADTDGDGLSDWDEQNIYRTNPNLRDTCGDGQPDNVRVATGKNLNCQAGKATAPGQAVYSGGAVASSTASEADKLQQLYPGLAVPTQGQSLTASSSGYLPTTADLQSMLPRDPAAIRAALQGKVDAAKLNQLTDQQLLEYYDEAIAIQSGKPLPSTSSTSP